MSRRLIVRRRAKADIREAPRLYEARARWGRLVAEVDATLAAIRAMPMRFPG